MPTDTTAAVLTVPGDVRDRLGYWNGIWRASARYHYLFGVVSVAASVISTSVEGTPAKICSIVAAISTALIGFMHPERRYVKFVRAWRVLDMASMRYRHGLIDRSALLDAVEHGEALIAEFEDRYSDGGKAHDAAVAAAAVAGAAAVASPAAATATATASAPEAIALPSPEPAGPALAGQVPPDGSDPVR